MSTPTHEDWEDARQKRNEAATRFIWQAHGTAPDENGHPASPGAVKQLAEFYRWDAEMDRIAAELNGNGSEASK
jgi:hypothetical protein